VGEVHEKVLCRGKTAKLKGDLYHYSFKDFRDFVEKNLKYARLSASSKKGAGFLDFLLRPPWTFFKLFILKRGFLDGWRGLILASSYAFFTLAKYAFVKERSFERRN